MRERIDAQPAARLRLRRRGDARGDGERADDASSASTGEDAEHFAAVRALLDAAGVAYEIDPTLVRGLDYYTRTIFSFVCDRLGAQSEIGGGGRYDGLIEQLGGPPTPAVGWAAGIERILLALGEEATPEPVATSSSPSPTTASASGRWRSPASCAAPGSRPRSTSPGAAFKGQLKQADRIGARLVRDPRGGRRGAAARHGERRAARGRPGASWSTSSQTGQVETARR